MVAVWAFVGLLWLISGNETGRFWFGVASAVALAFFLWPYVQGPYLLYTRHTYPLRRGYIELASNPDQPSTKFADLGKLGFVFAAKLGADPAFQLVDLQVDIFIHSEGKDSAQLGQIATGLGTNYLMVFKTRFDDGFAFETSNGHTPPLFPPNPDYKVFRFPDLRSASDQYRLHLKIKEHFFGSRNPVLADREGEVAEFIKAAEVMHQRHATSRRYRLSASGEHYVYTLRAAIRHSWLSAWPVKPWRVLALHRRSTKMAKELGFFINPKPGRLEELGRRRT